MDTGGTRDIIIPGETGLLSATPDGLGADVARLIEDEAARRALGRAALARTRERFAAPAVVARVTALYRSLLAARPHEAARG